MDIMFVEVALHGVLQLMRDSLQDEKLYPGMSGYPGYHTGFETFDLVDRIYDPEFKVFIAYPARYSRKITWSLNAQVFRACAQLNLRLSLQLAESTLLPLKMEPYAKVDNVNLSLCTKL